MSGLVLVTQANMLLTACLRGGGGIWYYGIIRYRVISWHFGIIRYREVSGILCIIRTHSLEDKLDGWL